MQLNGVETDADRALCSTDKGVANALHLGEAHVEGQRPIGAERKHRRSNGLPSILTRSERLAPLPWSPGGGFSASMSELNAELGGTVSPAVGDYAGKRSFAIIGIESEATVTDAPAALHPSRLDHEQRRPGIGKHAKVIEVPVRGDAVISAVLAHRRDDDAVREFEIGEPDGREQGTGHVTRLDTKGARRSGAVPHRESGADVNCDISGAGASRWMWGAPFQAAV